ncbi:MAG: hypothetical protein RG741_04990 [Bacteroidales bacterium]|nr:hypothetical protein [Bacteroidales bacterium]
MNYKLFVPAVLLIALLISGYGLIGVERIMMRMESQSLQDGKTARVEATLFYEAHHGRLITKVESPMQQVMITNQYGELTIYDPGKNTVFRAQSIEYSSKNNLIYFFLNGNTHDMGLRDMGFSLEHTSFEDNLMITRWVPPPSVSNLFSHIELVHEDYLPIYAGYFDVNGKLVKKVFYSDYEIYTDVILPFRVTEFNYLPGGDSIINRITLSDVRFNRQAVSAWFDFKIPEDARLIE